MKNTKEQAELIRYERSPVAMNSLELLLNEARIDERKNQAALVSFRLDEIANQILNRELSGVEAAELLNQIAEHIITQSYDQH
ncbi:TPA: DUF2732 family protein [Yersinia enterocolitica]|uniref:DUF2732 family protein n=2 Tax=Yersiniaceae TaxID=1903411 RepID=UPI0005E4D352|nr:MULTISPECIES: DUF2732 family protein [Yersinia]EKN6012225.1 DUF2732 family protein [Yersinia enterocolitica]MDA5483187.1 DUF2732 family protein [Yersinia intermedia]CQH62713.1 Protein of uncharacterised function (DUF2732) [Yersinia enterocolitica]CQH62718.1 Protein of uncharacterised function (DUF2732) [Yersinia enterocolitica]CQH62739.1 Protein of uncharacterised function (DUF2732) [Yersinia enterocolitica]